MKPLPVSSITVGALRELITQALPELPDDAIIQVSVHLQKVDHETGELYEAWRSDGKAGEQRYFPPDALNTAAFRTYSVCTPDKHTTRLVVFVPDAALGTLVDAKA